MKKPKNYVDGSIPVYLRITISSKRAEISINRKIEPGKWISNAGRMKGCSDTVTKFNAYLVSLEAKLYDAYYALIREIEIITAEILKNKYTDASDRQRMLVSSSS